MELSLDMLIAVAAFSTLVLHWVTDLLRQNLAPEPAQGHGASHAEDSMWKG
ncbi:MAG: hypothetical protein JNL86_00165 [Nitrospira sp.]|jgi:hypothetical protein|nr:hypothetical protein [Nitrospira sp.]MCC7471340.1 hypothetical protein [Candidatus Nomurabacteria bacterium]